MASLAAKLTRLANFAAKKTGKTPLFRVGRLPLSAAEMAKRASEVGWIADAPEFKKTLGATGRWFSSSPEALDFYVRENGPDSLHMLLMDAEEAQKYHLSNPKGSPGFGPFDPHASSADYNTEYFLGDEPGLQAAMQARKLRTKPRLAPPPAQDPAALSALLERQANIKRPPPPPQRPLTGVLK